MSRAVSFFDFSFESEGPKGAIKKIARFTLIPEYKNVYNFAFGDLDEVTGDIKDDVVTNNGDGDKVLATVAGIIYDFTTKFPETAIFFQGSTPARTRWYQMGINRHWGEIGQISKVFGRRGGEWEEFSKGPNFEAFIGRR